MSGTPPTTTDPLLGPLAFNGGPGMETMALRSGSPGLNVVPSTSNGCGTTVATDERGVARPQGGEMRPWRL